MGTLEDITSQMPEGFPSTGDKGAWAFIPLVSSKRSGSKDKTSDWAWADPTCTTPVTASNWESGQPDNYGRQDCAVLHRTFTGWHDFPCCWWAQCVCSTNVTQDTSAINLASRAQLDCPEPSGTRGLSA